MALMTGPEWLANLLRAELLSSRPADGTRLWEERELVARTDVSRTVVREALRLLEAEHLVRVRPGRTGGVFAAYPDSSHATRAMALVLNVQGASIGEVLDMRALLEPPIVRMAAERWEGDDVELMRSFDHSLPARAAERSDFHLLVAHATHSRAAATVLSMLPRLTERASLGIDAATARKWMLTQYRRSEAGNPVRSIHDAIIDAIEQRDGDGAERLWRKNIDAYRAFLERTLGDLQQRQPAMLSARWSGPETDHQGLFVATGPESDRRAVGS